MSDNQPQVAFAGIRFENFQVQETHLVHNVEVLNAPSLNYNIQFVPSGRLSRAQGRFMLLLDVNITSTPESFIARLIVRGHFSFDPNQPSEQLDKLLTLNSTALVFPYVRAYISSLTALSGLPTIIVPTYNLSGLADPLRAAIVEVEEL